MHDLFSNKDIHLNLDGEVLRESASARTADVDREGVGEDDAYLVDG